ncbi:hypothetical protein ABBQ32_000222 [Trebouxia sp. C0010 RCD-2024]
MSSTLWRTRVTASLDHAVSSRLRVVLKPYAATGRHKELVSSRNVMGCKQPWNLHPSKVRPGANFLPQSGTAIVAVLGQDLPLILYEALVAAILAILILYYQQRPRGWSARDLVQTDSHVWLDPTDSAGLLVNSPNSSILSWKWDATMAYVNEPPAGHAVNVEIVDGVSTLDLIFKATCDIPAGTELFLDYGRTYDRSSYK